MSSVESIRAVTNELLTVRQSINITATTPIDYQAHVGSPLERYCDQVKGAIDNGRMNKCLIDGQLRHCVLTLRQLLITRFQLLCNSIQLENHVRYAFSELCLLLDLARDKINKIIKEIYGEASETIQHVELLNILLTQRTRIVVYKISNDVSSVIEKIARQEGYLLRTICAALLTLLPPPSWGDSVINYILREGLEDSMDDSDWTNFLMPGINSQVFRDYVTMATSRFWKAVSQDLVAMDHVSCGGLSSANIHQIAMSKGLEAHTVLSYTLLYTGVQLERHRANKDQDYVTCKILTLLLTDKCLQYGSHGNTLTAHVMINDLLQPCSSVLAMWLQSFSHTHFTNCLQANALQDCSQWYQCQLYCFINSWRLQSFVLLLMGDLPLLLTFMQQQLLPLVNSQLVGVANQLQVLVDDTQKEHEKLLKQCTLIKEHLSNFLKCFHDNLVERYQQLWKQPIKLAECAPSEVTKETVEHTLVPCLKACAALPPTTREICVTFCVTVAIKCWRNCVSSNGQRYSKQHFCQLLSDYTYMVSSASHDATGFTSATRDYINHLPIVIETRKALYQFCGIYYHSECDGSHDSTPREPASHDPSVAEIISKLLSDGKPTDQWVASMATRKKH